MPEAWLYIAGGSKFVQLDRLRNAATPGYVNNAIVTMTLVDASTNAAVTGEFWPVVLDYVSGSNGCYRATLSAAIAVTVGQRLRATILAVSGTLQRPWVVEVRVVRDMP